MEKQLEKQNLRVVVASESPRVRSFLSQIIEQESGVDIVGHAPNAVKALTLTRELRPNILVLDYYLPFSTGLDAMPLSRISGLDVAQVISEEIPKTKVILLNNLDDRMSGGASPALVFDGDSGSYCVAVGGKCVSVARWPESPAASPGELVFASIAARDEQVTPQKTGNTFDKFVFFGSIGFAAGWLLTLTIFLAPAGVVMSGLGAIAAIIGFAGKLGISSWQKMKNNRAKAG